MIGLGGLLVVRLLTVPATAVDLLEEPFDVADAVNIVDALRADRRHIVLYGVSVGAWCLIGIELLLHQVGGLSRVGAVIVGAFVMGIALLGTGLASAWGQWLIYARVWLALSGRLPWRMLTFLEDACQRGVLRRSGAVLQFRHARLQEHLIPTPAS